MGDIFSGQHANEIKVGIASFIFGIILLITSYILDKEADNKGEPPTGPSTKNLSYRNISVVVFTLGIALMIGPIFMLFAH